MASYKHGRDEADDFEPGEVSPYDSSSVEGAAAPSAGVAPESSEPPATHGAATEALFARQAGMVFGLMRAAVEETTAMAESRNAALAAGLRELQTRALRSIEDSAYATIELLEALREARSPGELTRRQIGLARRQGEAAGERLAEFLHSACNIAAALSFAPQQRPAVVALRGCPEEGDTLLARLGKLTARQKCVLQLLAEGLPNKVIAYRLGISETTVKAHVGEILRKLKVYSRARAIVTLAQLDLTPFGGPSNCRDAEA
jgi:ATP/maltotriose-dependent transcriptional regulator MalT